MIIGLKNHPAPGVKVLFGEIFCLVPGLLVFSLILGNWLPGFFRPLSLHLRTGLNIPVLLLFLFLYFSFRLPGWAGRLASLTLTVALFALALAGLWAIGQTQSTVLSGVVPLFDAGDYYMDALRLLSGQDFGVVSARRPLFPGLLAVVLWATHHNLMFTMGVFTLISALSCYVAAKQIQRTSGAEVAVLVLIILFLFYRHHSGTVMTENLGFPLGTLGFALLWRGTADRSRNLVVLGLFVFTLALNSRAGTFFVLPVLLMWGGRFFRKPGSRISGIFIALGTLGVIAGFAVNFLMVRLLATPTGVPFANFSYSLYGLASGGKSWNYVFETHPELNSMVEPYQSREIYRMAFELIQGNPAGLVKGALYNWSMFFSDTWYSAYSFAGGENDAVHDAAEQVLFLLCVLGFLRWFRKPDDPLTSLVGVAAIGILLSVPFLPPTDAYRMRPYAVSMIVFGLLPGMGLLFGLERLKLRSPGESNVPFNGENAMVIFTAALVAVMILGPVLVKLSGKIPAYPQATCGSTRTLVSVRFDPGTHVSIVQQNQPGLDWLPLIHAGRFRRNSHSLPATDMIDWAEEIEPRNSIFGTLDFKTMQGVLIVTPTDLLPDPHSLWQVCGDWDLRLGVGGYRVFYVREQAVTSP